MMSYQLLPFRFCESVEQVLVTNFIGDYIYLSHPDFQNLISGNVTAGSELYRDLQSKLIISSGNIQFDIDLLATRYRSKKAFVEDGPMLHMVVTTLRCNQQCRYCQASARSKEDKCVDMTVETAEKVAQKIMQSRSDYLKVEFQGGEPSLNFPAIKAVVKKIEELKNSCKKNIGFVICTNLYNIHPEQLDFFKKYNFEISTSIDGPEYLHNINRISWKNDGTYQNVVKNLELARSFLGDRISALLTISRQNIGHLREVIDTYIKLGLNGIVLRALNPYGRCVVNSSDLYYSVDEYIAAFRDALEYIISLGLQGLRIREGYTTLLLRRMLTPFATGFVDLQSPCGAALSCVIYNYNGKVYACDEGRMLSAMNDEQFYLGNVDDSYEDIFCGKTAKELAYNSIVESIPQCSDCAYAMWCGADPVRSYATTGIFVPLKNRSEFCKRHSGLLALILEFLNRDLPTRNLLYSWAWRNEI